jgi:hypothetical protein
MRRASADEHLDPCAEGDAHIPFISLGGEWTPSDVEESLQRVQ